MKTGSMWAVELRASVAQVFLEHCDAKFFLETEVQCKSAKYRCHCAAELTARFPFWGSARSSGLALRFEPRLELGNELVKAGFHPTGDLGPTPVLQGGDGDSQFEFDSILGLEVTTAIAADDF